VLYKSLAIILFLLAGVAFAASPDQPAATLDPTSVCGWVERFHVLNRPTRITLSDLDWLDHMPDVPPPLHSSLEEILKKSDITSVAQLGQLEFATPSGRTFRLPGAAQTMIRVFFALAGDPPCAVTNSSGQMPSQPPQPNQGSLDARLQTLQQGLDQLNQQVETDREQLAMVQKELAQARKSAQLGLVVTLVGAAVALLVMLKVIG
jgi:hypothetical protein